ncbi:Integrator complex subunit 4 [Halotydeus destructor]|nr:Integrator complex subunit 4 [Halotydeus destructor]
MSVLRLRPQEYRQPTSEIEPEPKRFKTLKLRAGNTVEVDSHIEPLLKNVTPINIEDAMKRLKSATSQIVKRECLSLLAEKAVLTKDASAANQSSSSNENLNESLAIVKILRDYSHHFDSRVRAAALTGLLRLHERGATLDFSLYSEFCEALTDDYEGCRISAIKLLTIMSQKYGDALVCVNHGDEQVRLADDAFAKVCSMVNDISITVRTQAAALMGKFTNVSSYFLEQTLDKKLMSNLRKKKNAHERHREHHSAGDFSSGKKWADDAPQGQVCPESVNLMDIGACGAFIHGLEDEFLEVRMAVLESLSHVAQRSSVFAHRSLDFLVDMFNDEIEEVRLLAIQCLRQILGKNIILREDQVDIILSALEDKSVDIREALHEMLGNCKLASKEALRSTIECLITNLKKYSQDRSTIWTCLTRLGKNHADFTNLLVEELLGIHPYLDLPEPSLEDPVHLCVLFIVFNAAALCPDIVAKLEPYTSRHYSYLRGAHPNLIPIVKGLDRDESIISLSSNHGSGTAAAHEFLKTIFKRIRNAMNSSRPEVQNSVIEISIRDLQNLKDVEPTLAAACEFLNLFLTCQLSIRKILVNNNWINSFLLSALQSSVFRSSLNQILVTTFRLNHQFRGIHPAQSALIQQTRVKAIAMQLMAIIHGSNASALSLCEAFLEELQSLDKHLKEEHLTPDPLTEAMIREISTLEKPKPGSVARILQPLFLSSENLTSQLSDVSLIVSEATFPSLMNMTMSSATISEPIGKSDAPIKFTAGLVLTLRMDAIITDVHDIRDIRIKIKYPDQQTYTVLPKLSDFRRISNMDDSPSNNYRLLTNVYLSHTAWTEACPVEIGLVLDFHETSTTALIVSQLWAAKTGSYSGQRNRSEHCLMVDLCKPVKIYIHPKLAKKTVI